MKIGILDYSVEAKIEQEVVGTDVEIILYQAEKEKELPDNINKLDAVMVWHHIQVSKSIIDRLINCKFIIRIGTGYDSVDYKYAGEKGIPVLNVPDYGTEDVAEHAWALLLSLNRSIPLYQEMLLNNIQKNWVAAIGGYIPRLSGKMMGIVGMGRIGTAMAMRAKSFGMDVIFYDPYVQDGYDKSIQCKRIERLEELFRKSDFVSLHTLLTNETEGMINDDVLMHCKENLMLINTSRGKVVKNISVYNALKTGRLRAFGADVLEKEPPDEVNDKLIKAYVNQEKFIQNRMLLTPHAAFYAEESRVEMRYKAAEAVKRMIDGLPLKNCVNKQYLRETRYEVI
ncbi:MAG: C-terminal binding protein [Dorea sp.]|jgi:Lactate dehydrogenase and related dehydrogenases|nr:C-terminal binding protein [Dorea sp.]